MSLSVEPQHQPGDEIISLEKLMRVSSEHSLSFAESSQELRTQLQNLLHLRGLDTKTTESFTDKLADATEAYTEALGDYVYDLCRILDALHGENATLSQKVCRVAEDIARESFTRNGDILPSTPSNDAARAGFLLKLARSIGSSKPHNEGETEEHYALKELEEETQQKLLTYLENQPTERSENQRLAQAASSLVEDQIIEEHSMQPQYFISRDVA